MFFSKPLHDVTYQDVLDFCSKKIKENSVLDYKLNFPSKLEKILAAFANTYGGLVIIGVGDKDGFPEDFPQGIAFERGLEEKVTSIVLTNITPPFFPEIQICPVIDGKTFVLIQVPQSANTPHAIDNNTLVYLRTGNTTLPEEIANLDKLHWLSKNRENAIDLRNQIVEFVNDRYRSLCQHHEVNLNFGELYMYIVPQYPDYLNFDLSELKDKILNLTISTPGGSFFPSFNRARIQTMQDSVYIFMNNKSASSEYTEYTSFHKTGLLLHYLDIGRINTLSDNSDGHFIYLYTVIDEYFNLLKFYNKLRTNIGIWGDFKVHLALNKMSKVMVVPINSKRVDSNLFIGKNYMFERVLSMASFKNSEAMLEELVDFSSDLHWSFDYQLDKAFIRKELAARYQQFLDSTD